MGEIVPFRCESRPRAAAAAPEGPAQILFFLGVRYERHDDESGGPQKRNPPGASPRRQRRRKRA